MPDIYIYDALRTPCGRGDQAGSLFQIKPIDLLARCLEALQNRNELDTAQVDDALLGCVTPFGDQGDNIIKTALPYAGWSSEVPGLQLNRFQASGLEALSLAAAKIKAGWGDLIVAGGLESHSRIRRSNFRGSISSDPNIISSIGSIPSGMAADLLATLKGMERSTIDEYAIQSHTKAVEAQKIGHFQKSIIPIYDENNILVLNRDELVNTVVDQEMMSEMETVFPKWGRAGFEVAALKKYPLVEKINAFHTQGNIALGADGAALVLLGNKAKGTKLGLEAKAKIVTIAAASSDLTLMHLGGIKAAEKALKQAKLKATDIDLWYTNESFAAVALHFQNHFEIDPSQFNACGSTIALGEPIGAMGAMLFSILVDELERQNLKKGLIALSAEGGMGSCMIIER